ncbi:S-adenosyl-L-methionine-dependent methyltransferase [Sistotremastrum niveocremeum HHB9708]|uniref:S-adenosyl-L-methionine-dependent methyltransferase n=1 Tax=Sistotremastrum niveocremeum HHB9708 TaxID=1314777 RepID=A0A164ZLX0_9AGAM|nr:S-adenosyl-L-methionine-dependent methyltransferase [Sistotremastrum niveocremeum HHB9708]
MALFSRSIATAATRPTRAAVASRSTPINPNSVGPFQVFDRNAKRAQRDRAALRDGGHRSRTVDYLRNEVAENMIERLLDVKRRFSEIVDVGSGPGHFAKLLDQNVTDKVTMLDMSEKLLHRDPDSDFEGKLSRPDQRSVSKIFILVDVQRMHADEESLLNSLKPSSVPAITSCLSLHWTNDLPGVLIQIREALLPDGLFLGAMLGGDTLFELRTSLQLAEVEREGGLGIRVSPMTDTRDVTNLLGRAGFTLLTVDIDEVRFAYPSIFELMEDLQSMGESNAVVERRPLIKRDILTAASAIYQSMHGLEEGGIPATFQVIYMIGWKPDPRQPKPLERGTGKTNLQDVL